MENELNVMENTQMDEFKDLTEGFDEESSGNGLLKALGIGALVIGGGAAVVGAWHRWGKPAMVKMKVEREKKKEAKKAKSAEPAEEAPAAEESKS